MRLVRKQETIVTNKVIKGLKQKGFKISRYYAKTTKSVYIKPDYGVCGRIRISDHNGIKKYKYRFNIIKNYKGPRIVKDSGYTRLYYNYNNIKDVIKDVEQARNYKLEKYGIVGYRSYMLINSKPKRYKRLKNKN